MAARDLEFSLSEALLDPDVHNRTRRSKTEVVYIPMLIDHEPHETVREPMILFHPPAKRKEPSSAEKKSRRKSSVEQPGKHMKQWEGVITEFFNKKHKVNEAKQGTLYRSRSFDTLHRRLKGWDDVLRQDDKPETVEKPKPQTFVYQPKRKKSTAAISHEKNETETKLREENNNDELDPDKKEDATGMANQEKSDGEDGNQNQEKGNDLVTAPLIPKRDSQEGTAAIYEVPTSMFSNQQNDLTQTTHDAGNTQTHYQSNSAEELVDSKDSKNKNPGIPTLIKASLSKVGSSSPPAPKKPARRKMRDSQITNSFTELDLMVPTRSTNAQSVAPQTLFSEDIGILRIKLLGVKGPQQQTTATVWYHKSDDEEETAPVAVVAPKDGLFCTLSINGKQSRFESSLQPLKPKEKTAVWGHAESEAVFYCTRQQQVFVTSRKLSLKDHDKDSSSILSQNPKAECFGVGIYPIANQTLQKISEEDGSINDWAAVTGVSQETTINLEPHGTVLLEMAYIMLNPNSKVTCNGSVTVKFLNGMDCFRNGEPCWTCCTIDIDEEDFGTTSSVLGMDDFLNKGFVDDTIEFSASNNTACRIQVWGFGNDETEYWFGETYVPLATILPYSEHIVHQEEENKPLRILSDCEKEIVMPLEPAGTIGLVFNMSPAPETDDEPIEQETIQMLEASGIFTPQAIAHFRQQSILPEEDTTRITEDNKHGHSQITTILEDDSLGSSNTNEQSLSKIPKKRFIPSRLSIKKNPKDIYASGEFDHLEPSPTSLNPCNPILRSLTHSLKDKRQTLRIMGSIKLQVPRNYQEKKFRQLPDNFDPYREIEVLKVEMRDIKAQLAETQFYREKAELKVKKLENEVRLWNDKFKGKKGRKYH